MRHPGSLGCALVAAAVAAAPCVAEQPAPSTLLDLTLEELSNLPVTSVSRRAEPLAAAPASVFVITSADIRRSGATSLPEALRLAPNLIVARVNAWDYAITSSRGFLATLGTKLLVMIDGRAIYTPLFAGVTWDSHDVMLEDIDRIEVISGPGGTTWGTNAVIGVINIVTKSAAETQGVLASGYAGNQEDGVAARYGGTLGAAGHWRAYAKHFDRDNFERANETAVRDGGWRNQGGFRADWRAGRDSFTLQSDAYEGEREEAAGRRELSGVNILGRWGRALGEGAEATVQAYYDRSERDQARTFIETLEIADIEARYTSAAGGRHRFTFGAGYRHADDRTGSDFGPVFIPSNRTLEWLNLFAQDEIALRPGVALTLGIRAEHNSYTGWETMPSARLAWQPAPGRLLWTALSRAVRSPSRIDREFILAPATPVPSGPNFVSEVANIFELGYRAQPSARMSYSLTAFAHDYDRLRSLETRPGQPAQVENRVDGETRGVEGWGTLQAAPSWRLSAGFVILDQDLEREIGSTTNTIGEARDPSHQWMLRSSHNLGSRVELDLIVRRVGELPSPTVPAYTALDAYLGWNISRSVTLALAGQNLLDPQHPEFGAPPGRAEVPRSLFARAVLRY